MGHGDGGLDPVSRKRLHPGDETRAPPPAVVNPRDEQWLAAGWRGTALRTVDLSGCAVAHLTGAFQACGTLISVDLSRCSSLAMLGESAFAGCDALVSIARGRQWRIGPR